MGAGIRTKTATASARPGLLIDTCNPAPGWLMDDRDCYDDNADARPDQVAYFAVHRGDASFDYDCDGFSSAALLDLGGCHGEPMCPDDVTTISGFWSCLGPPCASKTDPARPHEKSRTFS